MSVIKRESSGTSPVLFLNVNGEPMRFFIRPGPTKMQLQPLISSSGGILCRTQEPSAILLADPGEINAVIEGAGQFYISTQYIHDCVTQNQQLDIKSYRFSNLQAVQTRAASRKQRGVGRMGYSREDDTAILNFIAKRRDEAKGNRIWKQMECQGITSHSWQSMKDRFLKHLQHKLENKTPENKKNVSPLKESSSSEDGTPQPSSKAGTPKKTPKKKALVILSSDSDATEISPKVSPTKQPDAESSPEQSSAPQHPDSEKNQTHEIGDEVMKEPRGDKPDHESLPEKEQQQDSEQPEVSHKRARMDTDASMEDMPSGPKDQSTTPSEIKRKGRETSTPSGRKLGILERAAREFEDSQAIDGSQEDRPPSQASSMNASDTDEAQIMAARERAVREQDANTEPPNDAEQPAPEAQNNRSTQGPENDGPGPSSAALPIISNTHMFLFQQESQEDLSQPSEEERPSQNLLETKQHVVRLMQESKKDLVEVMKALLKASGDVTLALSYLLEGYDSEVHGRIWTKHDDKILLSSESSGCEKLHEKYGAERVSRRVDFLKAD